MPRRILQTYRWEKLTIGSQEGNTSSTFAQFGCVLEDAGLVDGRHGVFVFRADFDSQRCPTLPRSTGQLTKFMEREDHAPRLASTLKLATLGHYRTRYPDLEGVGDGMEGRASVNESFAELRQRTGAGGHLPGENHVSVESTYQVGDANLIYCTAAPGARPEKHWTVSCPIRSTSELARELGIECARQSSRLWRKDVDMMSIINAELITYSQLQNVINVYHGPVMYRDEPGRWLWYDFCSDHKGLAIQFLKRTEFMNQKEYRFVVGSPGHLPVDEAVFVQNTRELKGVFERCVATRFASTMCNRSAKP